MTFSLDYCRRVADHVLELLAPACLRIEVAGSIRRCADHVKDVEIVALPRMVPQPETLFTECSALELLIDEEVRRPDGPLRFDARTRRDGPRYKRLKWQSAVCVDLFIVLPPASWGPIFAIRTGPAEFSRLLVTKRSAGGAMPDDLSQTNGTLFGPQGRIEVAEEREYFRRLGLPCWEPRLRSAETLQRWLRDEAHGTAGAGRIPRHSLPAQRRPMPGQPTKGRGC